MLNFIANQRRFERRWLIILFVTLLSVMFISLCAGEMWLGPGQWLTPQGELFVGQIRLPRLLAVVLVGAALAVSGTVMQALFENPLAEPGLLGVSSGAGIALVAALLFGGGAVSQLGLSISAILGALIVTLILLLFARRHLSSGRLLLAGIALGMICSALMTWAVYFSSSLDLRQLIYWLMGGFSGIGWQHLWLMLSCLPVIVWLCRQDHALNLLALGTMPARQLGLSVGLWRNLFVIATGWLVGVSVALSGAISFVGLVIPHLLRLLGLSDHRVLLPASALAGGSVLAAADIVARLALASAEVPIGVVTATLGAPVFIWLLLRMGRDRPAGR